VPAAVLPVAERGVDFAVPGFACCGRHSGAVGRRGVEEPGTAQVLGISIDEEAEERDVDGHGLGAGEVRDDALGAGVELAGDDADFVAFIQGVGERLGLEARGECFVRCCLTLASSTDRTVEIRA
jgi:hypothetical protein